MISSMHGFAGPMLSLRHVAVWAIASASITTVARGQPVSALDQARAALARGDVPKAVALVDPLLRRNPLDEAALDIKVRAFATARDWEAALGAYETFIQAGGDDDEELLEEISRAILSEAVILFPSIRAGALGRLACAGDRDALRQLRQLRTTTGDADVEILTFHARIGEFDAVLRLRELAVEGQPVHRTAALQALQQLRDRGAERAVLSGLADADSFVRLTAIRATRALDVRTAVDALWALTADSNRLLISEALASLAALGDRDAALRLTPLIEDPNPEIRLAAIIGLMGQQPAPGLLNRIEQLAATGPAATWTTAVEVLLAHAPERAAIIVRDALQHASDSVRVQALRLMPRVGPLDRDDVIALRRLLANPNTLVRIEAAKVLIGATPLCA
jgi:HEAT repeat protein